eukprot:4412454-Pyramimonas_sp.AAC.1
MRNTISWDKSNLPGEPKHEGQRRTAWLQIPLRTWIAIRGLRGQFGHVASRALVHLLRVSRRSSDYVDAAENYRCESCEHRKPLAQTHKVALPNKFCFNHGNGIDCLEVRDNGGERYAFLNIVCQVQHISV